MKYNKCNTYQEDSIGWFNFIKNVLSLQQITRNYITSALLNIYLSEGDIKTLQTKDKNKNGQYEVRIPTFYIHQKIIGNGNGSKRITANVYEISCHPKDSKILKVLLVKSSKNPETKSLSSLSVSSRWHLIQHIVEMF